MYIFSMTQKCEAVASINILSARKENVFHMRKICETRRKIKKPHERKRRSRVFVNYKKADYLINLNQLIK